MRIKCQNQLFKEGFSPCVLWPSTETKKVSWKKKSFWARVESNAINLTFPRPLSLLGNGAYESSVSKTFNTSVFFLGNGSPNRDISRTFRKARSHNRKVYTVPTALYKNIGEQQGALSMFLCFVYSSQNDFKTFSAF